jgi:hypothetical protein
MNSSDHTKRLPRARAMQRIAAHPGTYHQARFHRSSNERLEASLGLLALTEGNVIFAIQYNAFAGRE